MGRQIRLGSIHLTIPFAQTAFISTCMLIALVGLSELAANSQPAQESLLPPSVSGHQDLGAKLEQIRHLTSSMGRIDCLFIGNSTVQAGIDPERFDPIYEQQTGRKITCYNFSLVGASETGLNSVTALLIERYHPALIVYGASFEDLTDGGFDGDIPWVRFQQGAPSVEGWLETNLLSYRYFLTYRSSVQQVEMLRLKRKLTDYGFSTLARSVDVSVPIGPGEEYDHLSHYTVSDRQMAELSRLLAYRQAGVEFVIVEMPATATTRAVVEQSGHGYQQFLDHLRSAAQANDILFWLSSDVAAIPADGWQDYVHLDLTGSQVFTDALGRVVGQAAAQGRLKGLSR